MGWRGCGCNSWQSQLSHSVLGWVIRVWLPAGIFTGPQEMGLSRCLIFGRSSHWLKKLSVYIFSQILRIILSPIQQRWLWIEYRCPVAVICVESSGYVHFRFLLSGNRTHTYTHTHSHARSSTHANTHIHTHSSTHIRTCTHIPWSLRKSFGVESLLNVFLCIENNINSR